MSCILYVSILFDAIIGAVCFFNGKFLEMHNTLVRILLCFSLRANITKLFNTDSGVDSLRPVHGMRFISLTWVVAGHSYLFVHFGYFHYSMKLSEFPRSFLFQAIANAAPAVDTFIFISGLLTTYGLFKTAKPALNVALYLIHRVWRLMPSYCIVMALLFMIPLIGSGPVWFLTLDPQIQNCRNNWWTNFLFANNYLNTDKPCLEHTWYLAVDLQLHLLGLLILLPLVRWPNMAWLMSSLVGLGSMVLCGWLTIHWNLPPTVLGAHPDPELVRCSRVGIMTRVVSGVNEISQKDEACWMSPQRGRGQRRTRNHVSNGLYFKSYPHIGPYVLGLLVGYYLRKNPKIKIRPAFQALFWVLAFLMTTSVLYGAYGWNRGASYGKEISVAYAAFARTAWGLGIAWVAVACINGYGGPVNDLLSWPAWIPLSRLSYVAYLIHPLVQWTYQAFTRERLIPYHYYWFYLICGHFMITMGLSFIVSLLVEAPFLGLEKIIFGRPSSDTKNNSRKENNSSRNPPNNFKEDRASYPREFSKDVTYSREGYPKDLYPLDEPSESEVVISRRGRGRPRYIRTGKPGRPRKEYPTANLSTQELLEAKYLPDPKDAEEALSGRDSYFWKKAMEEEFDSLIENKTWELVDPPKNRNIIGTKWVFKTKCNSDGSVERHKARLVAKGYSQQYGIDYEETFAPVVRQSTIRMFLALAVEYNLILHQMDVQSAYLNGEIKEEIYMTQPENFVSRKYPERVCRLKKAIYGLKQAGIVWHERLDNELKYLGLKQIQSDNCVYIKHHEGILLVAIYVDDLIIAAEREDTLKSFKESMKRIFKIKDLGGINCCLGIRIQMKEDGLISIDQERDIEELLAKYRMKEAKPISTPMDSNSKLTKISSIEGENEPVKKVEYQSLIGSLIYLSVSTRPDIAYAVSALGQFSNDPRRQHWNAAKRVLRYLKGTSCLRITYRKSNEALHGYVDADWGGNLVDRKSHTGIVYFLARGPIAWESKKQQTVTLSSTESEYIALCKAGKAAVYLRALLDEMGFGELLNGPTVLKTDNQGAQQLARNPVYHARTKHIDIKWHFIRSICSDGLVEVVHTPTQENVADILTKGLPRFLYEKHVTGFGM
ncbi:hypothetical protein LAZ67_2006285 [Cordylochernes scorpioides]|uniref:Uncharacterized protein n=1 Tax=Cordylochernes scorpioides TaxID=51811 RepID=A0ABY6K601_9ARAC|nr:hypothetical protein LAZ67_2006285 [Cordylochernes scorpioides]